MGSFPSSDSKCVSLAGTAYFATINKPHETKWTCTHDNDTAADSLSARDILASFKNYGWNDKNKDKFVRPYHPNQCVVLVGLNDNPKTVGEISRAMICSPPNAPRNEYVTAGQFFTAYEELLKDCNADGSPRVGGTVPFNDTKIQNQDSGDNNQPGGGYLYLQLDKTACNTDEWYCPGKVNTDPPGQGPLSKEEMYKYPPTEHLC